MVTLDCKWNTFLGQNEKQKFFDPIQVIFSRIEAQERKFLHIFLESVSPFFERMNSSFLGCCLPACLLAPSWAAACQSCLFYHHDDSYGPAYPGVRDRRPGTLLFVNIITAEHTIDLGFRFNQKS